MKEKVYICIDLKSFYASVECVERGLDPLTTNLVVADASRTEKTICLAISPSLKKIGIGGRARLFEVNQKVKEYNYERRKKAPYHKFIDKSCNDIELSNNDNLQLDFIIATPQMAKYIEISSKIYSIYLKYISSDDIHVYSIDEVFMDVTNYLKTYKQNAHELAMTIIKDVLSQTGITATAGIGTNMYLAKVAMDIVAKKMKADKDGVRIASLDEMTYRKLLWDHTPLTDFWRVGHGYQRKLEANNLFTMGDIALCSIENEDLLYSLFGINAELLIDHAWGYEPCEITHIKNYKPQGKSLGSGQVLHCAYDYKKTKLVVKEMIDSLALDLCDKRLLTNQVVLSIGYDIENLTDEKISANYKGEICVDYLGRKIPKHSHGTVNFEIYTSASKILMDGVISLFERIVNKDLLVRRINIAATGLIYENQLQENNGYEQLDLFDDYKVKETQKKKLDKIVEKEKKAQEALLQIKKKYGKNSIIKGMNLEDGATMKDRNEQIGGHKA